VKVSDYIAAFLAENGVKVVFEMTGGMITFLLDAIGERGEIELVSMHHEQAAAFAAEAVARMTGVPGVAMATSGPGAANLLTGIGSCYYDSVPAVFITGQVNIDELRGDSGVRQAGFQETDIVSIVAPITKLAVQVRSAEEIPRIMAEAFAVAQEGRPGPVLIDIPMNIQRQTLATSAEGMPHVRPRDPLSPSDLSGVIAALASAKQPLILAGGGVRVARATALLEKFAEATNIPVASTLMGLDVLPHSHPLRVGMIGTYGNRWANLALGECDCLLALGARFDVRQTGADVDAFRRGKTIIKVDVDSSQIEWRLKPDIGVRADIAAFLAEALQYAPDLRDHDMSDWSARIAGLRADLPDVGELSDTAGINPSAFMHHLSAVTADASAIIADVGQNQMWAAQSIRLGQGQRFLTSGGMGAMGFALPAAIGVAMACPESPVYVIAGDGGVQLNIQELETVRRLKLPVKIVVLNNSCLGMVRQMQDELFDSRYQSTMWGYGAPDFVKVANAYGLEARRIAEGSDIQDATAWLAEDAEEPKLLEVMVDSMTCVRPKVTFGNPVFVMDPPPDQVF